MVHVDWDDLFAYATPRIIWIRYRRLGLLHYGLLFLTFVYVVAQVRDISLASSMPEMNVA